jgi:hypothetical protein
MREEDGKAGRIMTDYTKIVTIIIRLFAINLICSPLASIPVLSYVLVNHTKLGVNNNVFLLQGAGTNLIQIAVGFVLLILSKKIAQIVTRDL